MTEYKTNLRPIEAGDCHIIHSFLVELALVTGLAGKVTSSPESLMSAAFSPHPRVYGVLAELGGEAVGVCLFYPQYSSWRGEAGIYILDLFVKQNAQGKGLGVQLIEYAIEKAIDYWGANFATLEVDAKNENAQVFYQKLGFQMNCDNKHMVAHSTSFLKHQASK